MKPSPGLLAILFITAIWFGFLFTQIRGFPDDGNYHIKIAELMREQGIVYTFPWMQFTSLAEHFVDKHFLYHVFLIPFTLMGLDFGLKAATLTLITLFFAAFYLLLKKQNSTHPLGWALVLLFSSVYMSTRFLLGRAIPLGSLFFLAVIYFTSQKKLKSLAVGCFLFALSYAAYPIAPIAVLLLTGGEWLATRKADPKPFAFALGGTLLGILISPYFPFNLQLAFSSDLKGALLRSADHGINEWGPVSTLEFISLQAPLFFVLGLLALFHLLKGIRLPPRAAYFLPLTAFLFALSLKSIRTIDFAVPAAILLAANAAEPFLEWLQKRPRIRLEILLVLVLLLGMGAGKTLENFPWGSNPLQPCAQWLKENTPAQAAVFLWEYDDFVHLFRFNTRNYYTEGLDSYYLEDFNRTLWEKKQEIHEHPERIGQIREYFNSDYAVVERTEHDPVIEKMRNAPGVKKIQPFEGCSVIVLNDG